MIKRIKNTVIYLLARVLMGLVRRMGFARSRRFGRWLGRRAYRWARTEREKTLAHLTAAFPDMGAAEREALAQKTFEHFGMAAAECINIRRVEVASFVELTQGSREVLDRLFEKGQGVVYVSAHCGNWELMARALALGGYPVNTIGQKSYDPRFTRLIERFRDEGQVKTIWRGEPDVMPRMGAALAQNELMGLLIDQDTRVPGVFVPFFGRLAHTPTAAALLASSTGAPAVCGFIHRKSDGGYRVVVEEVPLSTEADPRKAVAEDTARFTACIEAHIREHPAEWVWMHRRWKTRPKTPDGKGLQS